MSELLGLVVSVPALIALAIVGYQSYFWLQHATWVPISVLDALTLVGISSPWLEAPASWLGFHAALAWAPASGAVFVLGLLTAFLLIVLVDFVRTGQANR